MKHITKIVSMVMVVLMLAACFVACGDKGGEDEYVIGMSGPLTGGTSIYGTAVKNSAEMAIEEINAAGGLNGVKFRLIATDDMNDAAKINTNYASLMEKGMQISLGTVTTTPGLEFKNYAKNDNLFVLTPSASGDNITEFDNCYQMCFADGNQGGVAAEYVNSQYKGETIGVFYKSDDSYSKGIFTQFKDKLDNSITVIETVFTDANATDFSTQIEKLKDCKFIFMPIYYTPASQFMIQAKGTIADDAVYYGCDGLDGIDSAEGFDINTIPQEVSMLSHFNSKATEGKSKEFIDKYVNKYGAETLNQFGASAYDCIYAIYDAMKAAAEKNPDAVKPDMSASDLCNVLKDQFNNGFTYEGVTGDGKPITWEKNGYVNKTAVKYVIKEAQK